MWCSVLSALLLVGVYFLQDSEAESASDRETRESDLLIPEDPSAPGTLWPSHERNMDTLEPQTGWWTTKPPPMYLGRTDSEEYDPPYYGQRPRAMLCAHRVVPYVLNRPPPRVLEAYYDGKNHRAHYGNNLTCKAASNKPTLDWDIIMPDMYYTSMMIAPDIPTFENSSMRYYLHSLTINILGKDKDKTGEDLVEYMGPAPHAGSSKGDYTLDGSDCTGPFSGPKCGPSEVCSLKFGLVDWCLVS
ncbi:uncharacterized protein LOC113466355 [Diaphorina citri]|uniref:Uncharacterized protein LOC113466355 n=1 Tax=Diaphorina citri TaxID=121845 RepID=A0A3Q0IMM7_DIACI|nr:uncharacterized protein LOC113466355 [Diaphorina citri]